MNATAAFWIFLGSGLGGVLRCLLAALVDRRLGPALLGFPIGTLLVNVLGSLAIGLVIPWLQEAPLLRLALALGFCGGFTTFSTFSLECIALVQQGAWSLALLNVLLSVLLCSLSCLLGLWLGTALHG